MTEHAERQISIARHRIARAQYSSAIDTLREVLGDDPESAEAHAWLAVALLGSKRLHAARHEAVEAMRLSPGSVLARFALARISTAQRKFSEAQQHLTVLIDTDPENASYFRELGCLHSICDRRKKAMENLERALSIDPEDAETLAEIAHCHIEQGNVADAENFARQALDMEADHTDAIVAMGLVLLKRGDVQEAREHAVWALMEDPESARALRLIAAVKARKNPLLGIWYRYNTWMIEIGTTRSILVLLAAFFAYRVATIATATSGHLQAASYIEWAWLAFVAYSFLGPTLFQRSLKKDLETVRLQSGF